MADTIVGAPSGRNHYLSKNPKILLCGMFAANGWGPAHEGGTLCRKCETRNAPARPSRDWALPDTMGGITRP